ncbi:MAG TPA: M48 family metallopeptidase [Candidatus Dormibacteraeota bacterium]
MDSRGGVRRGSKHPSFYRRTAYDTKDWYDAELVERARNYMQPIKPVRRLDAIVNTALSIALVLLLAGPRIVSALHGLPWPVQLVAVMLLTSIVSTLVQLPSGYWFQMVHEKKWGFSTQTLGTWVKDQVKSFAVGAVIGGVLLVLIFALIRATPYWWILGGLGIGAVVLVLSFVFPVLILPLFYKQKAVEGELKARIDRIAGIAGVAVRRAFVMDASTRSTRDNAFVGGLGRTKRVVVFDTILEHPGHVLDHVLAHELGHYRLRHIVLQVPFVMLASIVQFGLIAVLASWSPLLQLAGVSSLREPAALPLFSLLSLLLAPPFGLLNAWFTRVLERQADLEALELLDDPGAFIDIWRRLTTKNLGDLEPSWYSRAKGDHPVDCERMAFGKLWAELNGVQVIEPLDTASLSVALAPPPDLDPGSDPGSPSGTATAAG